MKIFNVVINVNTLRIIIIIIIVMIIIIIIIVIIINYIDIKKNFLRQYLRRTKLILKSSLSGMSKIILMNTLISFFYEIWCKHCEMDKKRTSWDRKTGKMMTMIEELHPRSDGDLLYVSRATCCVYLGQREEEDW